MSSMTTTMTLKNLSHDVTNYLQIIVSSMELGEPAPALNACKKIYELTDNMKREIMGIKHQ